MKHDREGAASDGKAWGKKRCGTRARLERLEIDWSTECSKSVEWLTKRAEKNSDKRACAPKYSDDDCQVSSEKASDNCRKIIIIIIILLLLVKLKLNVIATF